MIAQTFVSSKPIKNQGDTTAGFGLHFYVQPVERIFWVQSSILFPIAKLVDRVSFFSFHFFSTVPNSGWRRQKKPIERS
ncbi:hypothetical protein QUA81_00620 [Microcoleus sp. F6_B4]